MTNTIEFPAQSHRPFRESDPLPPAPRLLLILTEFPPSFGGMQTHASYLTQHLLARGYQLMVLTYRWTDEAQRLACLQHDQHCGYPVQRSLSRIGHWHNMAQVEHWQRQFQPDLIYASNVYYGLPGTHTAQVPVLARSVGNDVMRPWIVYPFRWGSRWVSQAWVERHLYRQFRRWNMPEWIERLLRQQRLRLMQQAALGLKHIFANSDYTAQALAQVGVPLQRVQVLVGGVDAPRFQPPAQVRSRASLGLPESGRLLLTACRLVAKKGIDFLLQQMPATLARYPNLHLVVIGEGREQQRCHQLAQQLGLTQRVHFVGRVSHETIHHYYWQAEAFVLASRVVQSRWSGLLDAETMGRVLCEANAAGVPVLASRSGGIPSVVAHEHNGLLFNEDDGADFQHQLQRLLQEPQLRAQLRRQGLTLAAQRFDWPHIIQAHEQVFQAVLKQT